MALQLTRNHSQSLYKGLQVFTWSIPTSLPWSPCCSLNTSHELWPQGLCTYIFFFWLESSLLPFCQISVKCHPIRGAFPDHTPPPLALPVFLTLLCIFLFYAEPYIFTCLIVYCGAPIFPPGDHQEATPCCVTSTK